MTNLGALLADEDPTTARTWYERGANAGNTDAMANLGVLLPTLVAVGPPEGQTGVAAK